jgi:hypothetical protein
MLSFLCLCSPELPASDLFRKILCSSASSAESAKGIAPISVLICFQRGGRLGSTARKPHSSCWLLRGNKIKFFVMRSGDPELSYLSYLAALILEPTYPDHCMLYPLLGKLLSYCLVESLDRVSEDQWNATNRF